MATHHHHHQHRCSIGPFRSWKKSKCEIESKKTQQGKGSQKKNGLFKKKNKNLKVKVKHPKQRAKVKSEKLLQSCILQFECDILMLQGAVKQATEVCEWGALTWLPTLTTRWSYTPRWNVFAPPCRDCLHFMFCFLFESVKFNPARSAFVSRVCVRLF